MTLRVLGVDPGLTRCGIGVVDVERNRRATMVAVGVVGTSPEETLDQRLLVIALAIDEWLDRYEPHVLAVERVLSQLNASTLMGAEQDSGAVVAAAAGSGAPGARPAQPEVSAAVAPMTLTQAQFDALVLGLPWQRLAHMQTITRM